MAIILPLLDKHPVSWEILQSGKYIGHFAGKIKTGTLNAVKDQHKWR